MVHLCNRNAGSPDVPATLGAGPHHEVQGGLCQAHQGAEYRSRLSFHAVDLGRARRTPAAHLVQKWGISVGVVSYSRPPNHTYSTITMQFKLVTTAFIVVIASFVQANPALTLD